jgi:hypothetical protein
LQRNGGFNKNFEAFSKITWLFEDIFNELKLCLKKWKLLFQGGIWTKILGAGGCVVLKKIADLFSYTLPLTLLRKPLTSCFGEANVSLKMSEQGDRVFFFLF